MVATIQPALGTVGDGEDFGRLSLSSGSQPATDSRVMSVMPGGLDKGPSHVLLPALVIEPRRVLSPLLCSLGTRPR